MYPRWDSWGLLRLREHQLTTGTINCGQGDAQQTCEDCKATLCGESSLQLGSHPTSTGPLIGDLSTGFFCPIVLGPLRRAVFDSIHGAAHLRVKAKRCLLSARFIWPHLASKETSWASEYLPCQWAKVHCHVKLQPTSFSAPTRRFQHIHRTWWAHCHPHRGSLTSSQARSVVLEFLSKLPLIGDPSSSPLREAVCKLLNINHSKTTAYHPQANSIIERAHRRMKEALRARAAGINWLAELPWVLLGIRSQPPEDGGITAA